MNSDVEIALTVKITSFETVKLGLQKWGISLFFLKSL